MPSIDIEAGKGIKITDDGELTVALDASKSTELKGSENGIWAKGQKTLSDQCTDEWSVITKPNETGDEKTIYGNARVVGKCYVFCMFRTRRLWSSDDADDPDRVRILRTKDPSVATADDLKSADDLVREINLQRFYAAKESDGSYAGSRVIPRPGSLIAFSDVVYGTTVGSTRIYEDGSRFPCLTTYTKNGNTIEKLTAPQKIYALFMVTRAQYTEAGANKQNYSKSTFPGATPSAYRCLMRIRLKCLWSDQTSFPILVNSYGWTKGSYLLGTHESASRDYGQWDLTNIYEDSHYNIS